jgi:Flp pilus assembly protein TadD
MTSRPLVAALLLAACATTRRPTPPPTDTAPTARDAASEVAYTTEPAPLTPEARAAVATAGEQYTNERFEEAEATLRAALERHPDDRAVRLRYALLHVQNGQPERAVPLLREGLRRVPDDADLWTFIGGVRLRQAVDGAPQNAADTDAAQRVHAWLEAARDAFAEALRARGNHLGAMEGSAVVASRLGAHADAVRVWERVVRLTHDRDAEEHLADAVAAAGDRRRAIGLYESLVQAEPTRATALASLATQYEAEGRADDARRTRGMAVFHAWVGAFPLAPTDGNVAAAGVLAPWFDAAPASEARQREPAVRAELERLRTVRTPDARMLLAIFVWHHSHDAMEALGWTSLRAHGPDAADTLFGLLEHARSMLTMRAAAESLARLHDPRLFDVMARVLPRDMGPLPIDAANALDLLGDPRAVPLLVALIQRPTPRGDVENPLGPAGYAVGRSRATLALGGFDTPESRAALQRLVADPDVGLDAHAALYRLTRAPAHLQAIERAPATQRRHAEWILADYIERAGTPQATAAATRARTARQAREAAEEAAAQVPTP